MKSIKTVLLIIIYIFVNISGYSLPQDKIVKSVASFKVQADGNVYLIVKDRTVFIHAPDYRLPQILEIDGKQQMLKWTAEKKSGPYNLRDKISGTVSLKILNARSELFVEEQPSSKNGYTAIVRIIDRPAGSPGIYEFELLTESTPALEIASNKSTTSNDRKLPDKAAKSDESATSPDRTLPAEAISEKISPRPDRKPNAEVDSANPLFLYIKRELELSPKFDRAKTESEVCTDLEIKTPPDAPKNIADVKKEATDKANQLADEKFPESLKNKAQQEAADKFKTVQVGEQVTVPVRFGRDYQNYTGAYKGTAGGKLLVGEKQILKSDLSPDILDKFDEGKVKGQQMDYVKTAYTIPRAKCLDDAKKSIMGQFDKDKQVYEKLQQTVKDKEKIFNFKINKEAIPKGLAKYLAEQDKLIGADPDQAKRLNSYNQLIEGLPAMINGLKLDLGDNSLAEIKNMLLACDVYVNLTDKIISEKKTKEKADAIARLPMCMFHLRQVNSIVSAYDGIASIMAKDDETSKSTVDLSNIINIKGRIYASIEDMIYEISVNKKRAILKTCRTRFIRPGLFKLNDVKYSGQQKVPLKNGFTDVWDVYEEISDVELDAINRELERAEGVVKFLEYDKYLRKIKGEIENEIRQLNAATGNTLEKGFSEGDSYKYLDKNTCQKLFPIKDGASGKYGFINGNGEISIEMKFDMAEEFNNIGIARVEVEGKSGFIDHHGSYFVIPIFNCFISQTQTGSFWGSKLGNGFIISKNFEKCRIVAFDTILSQFSKDSEVVGVDFKKNVYKSGYVDEVGNIIVSPSYKQVRSFSEGYAPVMMENKKFIFIDKLNKKLGNQSYDWAVPFSEGYASVKQGDKWLFIDKTGRDCFQVKYESPAVFGEGMAAVKVNGKMGFIDATGKIVISPVYDYADAFHEGLCCVGVNDKYGFINKAGKIIIPISLKNPAFFKNGLAQVTDGDDSEEISKINITYINQQGKLIWRPNGWMD
ncbi:MAG: WG repeat-containing protein [Victivallales bacterium]